MFAYAAMPQKFLSLLKSSFKAFPLIFKRMWGLFLFLAVLQAVVGIIGGKLSNTSIIFHLLSLLISLLFLYFYIVILHNGDQLLKQQAVSLKNSFSYAANRYWRVLGYGVLLLLLYVIVGGVVGFAAGGIFYVFHVSLGWLIPIFGVIYLYLIILFFCAMPAIILDKVKVWSSFGISVRLVQKNWWRVFGVFVCIYLLIILLVLLGVLIMWPLGLLKAGAVTSMASIAFGAVISFLSIFVFLPLIISAVLVIYRDLKLRKPGLVA